MLAEWPSILGKSGRNDEEPGAFPYAAHVQARFSVVLTVNRPADRLRHPAWYQLPSGTKI